MAGLNDLSLDDLKALKKAKETGDLANSGMSLEGLKALKTSMAPVEAAPKMSAPEAFLTKASESLQFGARPLVAGVGGAIGSVAGDLATNPKGLLEAIKTIPQTAAQGFQDARKETVFEQKKASEDQPVASAVGTLAGSAATAPLTSGKGLSLVAKTIGSGALQSGLEAVSEGKSLGDIGTSAGLGAAISAGSLGLGKVVEKGFRSGAEALKSAAESKAFKAAGAMLKDFRRIYGKGGEDKINELGRTIIDNKLISAGDTFKDIAKKSDDLLEATGKQIGQIYDNVLEAITDSARIGKAPPSIVREIEESGFKPASQKEEILSFVDKFLKQEHPAARTKAMSQVQNILGDLEQIGDNLTPQQQLKIKKSLDSLINYDKDIRDLPATQQAVKKVRDFVADKINKQVELIDNVWPSPQAAQLKALNKQYGNIMEIGSIAEDRALRDSANSFFGLRDTIVGSGLGAIGGGAYGASQDGNIDFGRIAKGAALGLGGALGAKAARTYGPALGVGIREGAGNLLGAAAPAVSPFITSLGRQSAGPIQRRLERSK